MEPDEMYSEKLPEKTYSTEEVAKMWPQARGELLGFCLHLDRRGSQLTAAQMRMAIWLADQAAAPHLPKDPER